MKMVTWQRLAEHGGTLLLSIYFLLRICIIPVWNLESCFLVVGHCCTEKLSSTGGHHLFIIDS